MFRSVRRTRASATRNGNRFAPGLEFLEGRANPCGNDAPVITSFSADEISHGEFLVTGTVEDDQSVAGMLVRLDGVPSAYGALATVQSDGTFSTILHLSVDGSDEGDLVAIAVDGYDEWSEPVSVYVTPTNDAPQILNFSVIETDHGTFEITGTLVDDQPVAGLTVSFGGVPSAGGCSAVVQADGSFSATLYLQLDGSDEGDLTAWTEDVIGVESDPVCEYVCPTNDAPAISDYSAVEVSHGVFQVSGVVCDDQDVEGLMVWFGGVPSAEGNYAVVQSDGTFSTTLYLQLDGSDEGDLTAWTEDAIGVESDPVCESVCPTNDAPAISHYSVEEVSNGVFQVSGVVCDDQDVEGLIVWFGGVPSAEGNYAVVQSDGTFTATLYLQVDGSDEGDLTAWTEDEIGVESEPVSEYVSPTNDAPVIESFSITRVNGDFLLSGSVSDDQDVDGLWVWFGGIDSVEGCWAYVDANGSFSITVTLQTDGSDDGWITAVVWDFYEAVSNEMSDYVCPSGA